MNPLVEGAGKRRVGDDDVELRQTVNAREQVPIGREEAVLVACTIAYRDNDMTPRSSCRIRKKSLPQKMFVLHQFSLRMIAGRERLDTSHDELATVIHVDGQGSQPAKAGT